MPSATERVVVTKPHKSWVGTRWASRQSAGTDQVYQGCAGRRDIGVDDGDVELRLRGHLLAGGLEAARHLLGALGAATAQPALQLGPARWGEEHHQGSGHPLAYLARALQVDLEQRRASGGECLLHGGPRGAVARRAVHDGPLEQAVRGYEAV